MVDSEIIAQGRICFSKFWISPQMVCTFYNALWQINYWIWNVYILFLGYYEQTGKMTLTLLKMIVLKF